MAAPEIFSVWNQFGICDFYVFDPFSMTAFAPHLPPPACSVETHTHWTRVKLFALTVLIALLTGLVGALIMVNAWYPTGLSNSTILISNRTNNNPTLDVSIVRDWRSRVIELFDETKIQQGIYYTEAARVTQAAVVSAGGWSVAPLVTLPSKVNLVGIDYQGHRLAVEKIIVDETHKLIFIKFIGADFRANSVFAPRSILQPGRTLWGLEHDWQPFTIGQKVSAPASIVSAANDNTVFSLLELGATNRLLITDRGELVGFTAENQAIIPVWMVGHLLSRLSLPDTEVALPFEWRGSFVESIKDGAENKDAGGFLVHEVLRRNLKVDHAVKKGDVIVKIQNQTVTRDNLAELILSAPDEFLVVVMRGEKNMNLIIKK